MASKTTPGIAAVVSAMSESDFKKIRRELKDAQDAVDDAGTVAASQYKKLKKQGHHIDALKMVNKLVGMDNPAKVISFLSHFDKYREVAKLDAQSSLFEEDKTKPQKEAEAAAKKAEAKAAKNGKAKPGKETKIKAGNGRVGRGAQKQIPAPKEVAPANGKGGKKALFAESDEDAASVH